MSDPDQFTTPFALTKAIHREPYPFLSPEKSENRQDGKVIIITGGGTGIGAAAAKVWARAGAQGIVITGRRLDRLEKIKEEIKAVNKKTVVLAIKADISTEKDVVSLFAEVKRAFGKNAEVLLNNAATIDDSKPFSETSVESWWSVIDINLKGLVTMLNHYINTQEDPKKPVGTVITVLSGRAGLIVPNGSNYDVSKLAEQCLIQHVQAENPTLRMFMTMPGVVETEMTPEYWVQFAKDHADLTGLQALYFAQPRADYLKGLMTSVNWDHEVMEKHKDEIVEKKLLEMAWIPGIPMFGGSKLLE